MGELSRRVGIISLLELLSTVVSFGTVFVTLFATTVGTVSDGDGVAILTFDRFGGMSW